MSNTILTLISRRRLEESYANGYWRDDTIASLVWQHATAAPDRIAVRDRSGTLSYRQLADRAQALCAELARAGLKQGDRIAVWLSSRIETAIALVACSRSGFVCCPSLHRDHTTADIIELMNRMRAAAFIGEQGYGADASRHDIFGRLGEVPTLKHHYRLDKSSNGESLSPSQTSADAAGPVNTDPNHVVYLAFTSGTTGKPKGVMHSDNTLLANARAMIGDWRFDAQSVIYTMSPLSHNLGLGSLIMALAAGAELVVHDLPRGASTLDRIIEVGATFIVGVPTHAMDLLGEMKARNMSAPGAVKGFRISGASAPRDVIAELLACGVSPQSGYGMTEAGSHHYTHIGDDADRVVNTSGRACKGYEVKIFSQDNPNVELPVGETGQIGGRGASLMLGYFDDQGANDASFNAEGWFMTGDLGRLDERGYLQITGRKKDLIIRGGHNIYPAHIENLAMQHPAVARAAALPVPDRRLGEKVCLAMMLRPGFSVTPDEVLIHLDRSGLSRYDMPEYVLMLDHIPLTASGKILKRDIATQIVDGSIIPSPIRFVPRESTT
ncbi:acyl--CoA ligase (plasmid) [Alicycliphilus denitrificans]|uniref:Acyl--CoA ligase n=1 Tax=Alicycliphilus denitrificans TaxID=179636 RepID=A0A858ZMZ0_9BURK|nr:class I adenylate-forming enzyme family protein [Alicycliphilus denitrificans]QKD42084.1 acyl--CoA ligase [Alicycliphilus denitrificans]QKD42112.1 acyl--CoA ligase [Alicycliphilus denitrificans]